MESNQNEIKRIFYLLLLLFLLYRRGQGNRNIGQQLKVAMDRELISLVIFSLHGPSRTDDRDIELSIV